MQLINSDRFCVTLSVSPSLRLSVCPSLSVCLSVCLSETSCELPGESYVLPDEFANIKQLPDINIIAFSENVNQRQIVMFELTVGFEENMQDAVTTCGEQEIYKQLKSHFIKSGW